MSELDAESRRFLEMSMIARIATISSKGRPQIMPLWFFIDGSQILMNNADTSPTVRNIRRNPNVVMLFLADRSRDDQRCLRIKGEAEFTNDRAVLRRVAGAALRKYYAAPGAIADTLRNVARLPSLIRYRRERAGGGVIRVTPVSWEFLEAPDATS